MYHRLYRSRNRNLIRNIFTYLGSENKQLLFSQTKLQDWGFFVNWSIISCREEARFLSTIHARFPLRSVKPCNCWERCSQPLEQISHIVWTLRSVWMDRHIVFRYNMMNISESEWKMMNAEYGLSKCIQYTVVLRPVFCGIKCLMRHDD